MINLIVNWLQIEEKWRKIWDDSDIFQSDVNLKQDKYFLTVAYPYPNSPQHIGHGRTYTLADVHARYMRMKGKNVLFPMAFHYTGTPIIAMSKRLIEGDQYLIEAFINIYRVPSKKIEEFKDPLQIARYFHEEIKQGMKEMGYSIDWRREFTTIDPQYSRFIEWQFNILYQKGYIIQGSHPVGWCPKCESPVGQHDTLGDVEPEIGDFILIKFKLNNYILPSATLRPETIFGVTNIWLNPDVDYIKVKLNNEYWIVSNECLKKLNHLKINIEKIDTIKGAELLGKYVKNPITNLDVPILPASFVDPKNATGVVMSVPGHAPYDYQALEDLKRSEELKKYDIKAIVDSIKPISIIEVEGYSDFPALDVIKKLNIKNQDDSKLKEATEEVYNKEFHSGIMKANTLNYSGLPVSIAKERIKQDLITLNVGETFYEILNRPVICRCGSECIIKIFENQWFIDYSNESWKELAEECLDNMNIVPSDLVTEFRNTIRWLKQKACARKSGLGTRLPWDREWIIESLSDSVIYMAYYTIAKYIKLYNINSKQLTNDFFDYIFLGKGNLQEIEKSTEIQRDVINKMREEFLYYYPLDSRHSGRDLIPNHLTFFLFNHTAIFPKSLWPKQIAVNGSVLMEGKKMSKSIGNIIPLREAIQKYGSDPIRLAILSTAELLQDVDFSPLLVQSIKGRLERFYYFVLNIIDLESNLDNIIYTTTDKWLLTKLQKTINLTTIAMNELRIREAINYSLYELDKDLQWYLKRCPIESSSENRRKAVATILKLYIGVKIRLLSPFIPFLCEELWEKMGGGGLVSLASWPNYNEENIDNEAEEIEEMIVNILEDTKNILKVTKLIPNKIYFYTSAKWKWNIYLKILNIFVNKDIKNEIPKIGELMKLLNDEAEFKSLGKELYKFVQKIYDEVWKMPSDIKKRRLEIKILDENSIFKSAQNFIEKELNTKIQVYSEEDIDKFDPQNKGKLAQPYRMSIYVT